MRLEKVRIKGFRNFDDTEVTFQKKTLIIGANDVGKSNLLYALRILFDKTISEHDLELTESDYNAYSSTDTIEITAYLCEVTEDCLLSTFGSAVKDGKVVIRYTNQKNGTYKILTGYDVSTLSELQTRQYIKRLNMQYVDTNRNLFSFLSREKIKILQIAREKLPEEATASDSQKINEIQNGLDKINESISSLQYISTSLAQVNRELGELSVHNEDQTVRFVAGESKADKMLDNLVLAYSTGDTPLSIGGDGRNNQIFLATWIAKQHLQKNIDHVTFYAIEEPEAHLHVQVQQVFIKNAYDILRNNPMLKNKNAYCTQMIVSTHSSSIALECKFADLRYFRRTRSVEGLPISVVINLSNVFGVPSRTSRFVTRYLRTTHYDLFFADAAILIEGAGERIFMPYFINKYEVLNDSYISVLEIGGRYAHYLKPMIDTLGISCLVITDIDCAHGKNNASVKPERGKKYFSSNPTIQNWVVKNADLDYLLNLDSNSKIESNPNIAEAKTRIAYQKPVKVLFSDKTEHEFIPTTFEDSLAYTNFESFKSMNGNGLIKKFKKAFKTENATTIPQDVYNAIKSKSVDKAQFALDMIFNKDPQNIEIPVYIAEGLKWLENEILSKGNNDFLSKENE